MLTHLEKHSVGERLDALPITVMHALAIVLCAGGFTFDLFEMALGSALSAVFSAAPHTATPRELSWLLASVYVGAIVGAPLLGWVADHHGRRIVLTGVLLWLGAFSFCAAYAQNIEQLTLFRGISGVALGAYPPLMVAYLTDLLPPSRRGTLMFVTIAIAAIGPAAGIFLIRWLTPIEPLGIEAWRWGFLAGGLGALITGMLFFALPESPRWLESKGRTLQASHALMRFKRSRQILAPTTPTLVSFSPSRSGQSVSNISTKRALSRWVLVGLLFLLSPWSTVAFPLLTGAVLMQKGLALGDTLFLVGISALGPLAGTLIFARAADRIERRRALAISALFMVAAGWCFVVFDTRLLLIGSSVLFSVFASLYVSVMNVYGAELFSTKARASSISAAWAMNRAGAAAAPLLLLPLLREGGAKSMFIVIAATLGLSLLLLLVMPKGQQLQPLN